MQLEKEFLSKSDIRISAINQKELNQLEMYRTGLIEQMKVDVECDAKKKQHRQQLLFEEIQNVTKFLKTHAK